MAANRTSQVPALFAAAIAAFCTYFCMYAFRKPFTAATFDGQEAFGFGLKTVLVISQLAGYMLSKFIGIKVISELRAERRAAAMVGMIAVAEGALIGFAYLPVPLKVFMLFFNGLPLGMVFGLVLAYLEGRKQTEALSAALCASFILSSGVVKSIGRWLILDMGVGEFQMPMVAGLLFLPPLLLSVWFLQRTPPPNDEDRRLRAERKAMSRAERAGFLSAYRLGLALLVLVYVALTVIRTIRDDFGVEIWRDMGIDHAPGVFAQSETVVALFVTGLNGLAILVIDNRRALRLTFVLMGVAFGLVGISALWQFSGTATPFGFMVLCGVGLYIPYVAFHTTVFERLIAASSRPCNIGFLMYLADAMGYLGYALVMVIRARDPSQGVVLPFFTSALLVVACGSIVALVAALLYFERQLRVTVAGSEAPRDVTVADPVAATE